MHYRRAEAYETAGEASIKWVLKGFTAGEQGHHQLQAVPGGRGLFLSIGCGGQIYPENLDVRKKLFGAQLSLVWGFFRSTLKALEVPELLKLASKLEAEQRKREKSLFSGLRGMCLRLRVGRFHLRPGGSRADAAPPPPPAPPPDSSDEEQVPAEAGGAWRALGR